MIIMKFGGSSLSSAERIKHVASIIKSNIENKPIIIASAMGDTTENLLAAGEQALLGIVDIKKIEKFHYKTIKILGIRRDEFEAFFTELRTLLKGISLIRELSPRTKDYLVSFGERLSVRVLASYLSKNSVPAKAYDGWDLGLITDSIFTNAEVHKKSYVKIAESLQHLKNNYSYTPVVTGFIGKDKKGNITTLGRGGSDLTASVFGVAVGAREIQVWKDVDGILTTDPSVVKNAISVPKISFEEASELAYFGAKVLHPRSIIPAMKKNIQVRVKNSYSPSHPGTLILSKVMDKKTLVRVITYKKGVTLIDIVSTRMLGQYGFLAAVFQIFNELKISVDMVATSEVSISITLDNNHSELYMLKHNLQKISTVSIKQNKTIVTLIGNVARATEIIKQCFIILDTHHIDVQMVSHGASKVNISLIIDNNKAEQCVQLLHKQFFEEVV